MLVLLYFPTGNGWLTLLNPVMFANTGENTLHVFGAINFLAIPMVWAFYPETANRTLEEIDYLFVSNAHRASRGSGGSSSGEGDIREDVLKE